MNPILALLLAVVATGVQAEGVCDTDYHIVDDASVQAGVNCHSFKNLNVEQTFKNDLNLPNLKSVVGEIKIDSQEITGIIMPALEEVNKLSVIRGNKLKLFSVSHLHKVDEIAFEGTVGNIPINFNAINSLRSLKVINTHLTEFTGINVTKVESIRINGNPYLKSFAAPELETIKNLFIQGSTGIKVSAPKLTLVNGNLDLKDVGVADFPKLNAVKDKLIVAAYTGETFSLPALTEASKGVHISKCKNLKSVSFPVLNKVDVAGLVFQENGKLNELDISKLNKFVGGFVALEPTLTVFKHGPEFSSDANAKVEANLDCKEIEALKFTKKECKSVEVHKAPEVINQPPKKQVENKSAPASEEKKEEKKEENKEEKKGPGGNANSLNVSLFSGLVVMAVGLLL